MNTKTLESSKARRLTIKAGINGSCAIFHPNLYQLVLVQDDDQKKVELGFSCSRILECLLQFPGEVVTREQLMEHAWPGRVVGQGSLNQQIYTLRQTLGDEKSREIIQTLPRRGYQFNSEFLLSTDEPEQVTNEAEQATVAPTPISDLHEPPTKPAEEPSAQPFVAEDPFEPMAIVSATAQKASPPASAKARLQRLLPASFCALGLLAFGAAGYLVQCDRPQPCVTAQAQNELGPGT